MWSSSMLTFIKLISLELFRFDFDVPLADHGVSGIEKDFLHLCLNPLNEILLVGRDRTPLRVRHDDIAA
jgi:hypothetical protein